MSMFECRDGVFKIPYLKCVSEVPSCDGIAVGDLLWKRSTEIHEGGYEYAVLRRRGDLREFRVRQERLDECFEVEEVDETAEWVAGWLATVALEAPAALMASYQTVTKKVTNTVVGGL